MKDPKIMNKHNTTTVLKLKKEKK